MDFPTLHAWDVSPAQAIALQKTLAKRVRTSPPLAQFDLIAGVDVSYQRFSPIFHAAIVVWRASDGAIVETRDAVEHCAFPYIPGLLSFRELPILLKAFRSLETRPDVVMADGQGKAHPRRLGLACHLGLWLQVPCLGCAKTRLCGTNRPPGNTRGKWSPLWDKEEIIGQVVRTKSHVKPVFVSVGHQMDLASATRVVLECCRGYRLPEPTRLAHLHGNLSRRGGG